MLAKFLKEQIYEMLWVVSNCVADKFYTCICRRVSKSCLDFQILLCHFRFVNIELFTLDCSAQKMVMRVKCESCMIPKYGLHGTCFTHLVDNLNALVTTRYQWRQDKALALWKWLDRCFHSNVLVCHLNMIFGLFLKAVCLVYNFIDY